MRVQKKSSVWKWILWIFLAVVITAVVVVLGLFRVREADVIGNEYYSADVIKEMVMKGSLGENSIYLKWKYSQKDAAENLPFLNGVEIDMVNPYHIQIRVYEKEIVGYVTYSGSLVYFDKDGMVVDISQEKKDGVPAYSGINISQPEEQKPLPVTEEGFLEEILESTSLIKEIGIQPKQIHYDENHAIILYFAQDLRVLLGKNSYLEEKLTNLLALFPKMEGMSGTLHMEDFTAGTTAITFKKDEMGEEELIFDVDGPEGEEQAEPEAETETETEQSESISGGGYIEKDSRFNTDANGDRYYIDDVGNMTYTEEKLYTNSDGSIITDGYGYIDPYTGAYILN